MNLTYEDLKETNVNVLAVYKSFEVAEAAIRAELSKPVEWDITNEARAVELYNKLIEDAEVLYETIAKEVSDGVSQLKADFIGPITIDNAEAILFVKELRDFDTSQLTDTLQTSQLARQAIQKYKEGFGAGGLGDVLGTYEDIEHRAIADGMKPLEELDQASRDLKLSYELGLQKSFPNWDRARNDFNSRV